MSNTNTTPIEKDVFISPTLGRLTFDQVFEKIVEFTQEEPDRDYNLIIGTDSLHGDDTTFVTAVILHKIGKGGRYFYRRFQQRKIDSLRQRIMFEASLSLELAYLLTDRLSINGYSDVPIEIHIDVGEFGETKKVIQEVVGYVRAQGFKTKIKPDSVGASHVADKHSK